MGRYSLLLTVLFVAVLNVSDFVSAFNIDSVNYIRHEGLPDTMFGFSVALHKEANKSWVIIGAPEKDTSDFQPGVKNGGAVYRCDISDDNRCQIIPFDRNGNQYNTRGEQIDTKSHQWFGATVASTGVNGPLVACAPRYVFHMMQPKKTERNEPVGTCFISKNNFQVYTEYSPCRTSYWGYHRQGSCQAGLSAAITKDGKRLFVGAPGSWYWQGQVYSAELNNPENKVYSTSESTSADDDSYLGYSTVTGDFNGDGVQDVAIGMPRGGGLLGKVLIFSWNMVNLDNITGEQIGAYFGYSLCTVDVDGDKLDDLLIGAPMYTEPNNEGKYETGRVYIMFQGAKNKFKTLETRDGVNSRGRFGLALTSLGDINLDGYGDFAVGAPYDGPDGRGAVYIYHGSKTGPLAKHSQVIFAEDVVGTQLSTFGFALSGGLDLDGNLYPDLVVGAYKSNKAIVFKSRPVAVVEASTIFESDNKLISLDSKNCTIARGSKQVPCTSVRSCLRYNGINLPPSIDIEVSWVLDAKKTKSPRMFFLTDEGRNIRNSSMRLYRGKTECRNERVYIMDNIRDKLTPLEVEMRYQLRPAITSTLERRKRAILEPVIDTNLGLIKRDSINIQKNCGPDNNCIPDLRLFIKTIDQYLLGSKDLLVVEVLITNHGEDAFEAGFYMSMPQDLNFKRIDKIGDLRDTPITCTAPSPATNHTLRCDIGNPLSANKVANFRVIMIPSHKSGMAPSYDFYMEANSTNPEADGSGFDNVIKKSIGIWVETDLSIEGTSIPNQQLYNVSEYKSVQNSTKEHDLGPSVVHMYNIRNNGPSTIEEAEVYILWPYETKSGELLMYLLNQPETSGNIKCDPTIYANERFLTLDKVLSEKSYLESSGAVAKAVVSSWGASRHGVHIEHSSSSSSSSSSTGTAYSGGRTQLTEEEKRRLEADANIESTGDASFIHTQRANAAAAASSAGGHHQSGSASGQGGRQHSYETSWRTSSQNGGPPVTYTSSRNRTYVRGQDGDVLVSESSTEHYGLAGVGLRTSGSQASSSSSQARGHSSGSHSSQSGYNRQSEGQYQGSSASSQGSQSRQQNYEHSQGAQHGGHAAQGSTQYYSATGGHQSGEYRGSQEHHGRQQGGSQYSAAATSSEQRRGSTVSQGSEHQSGGAYGRHSESGQGSATHYQQSGAQQGDSHYQQSGGGSHYQQSGGGSHYQQSGAQGNFEANRIESGRGGGSVVYGSRSQADAIDLEAQRQAYAEQSGSSTRRRMKSQQDGEPPRPDLITGVSGMEKIAQGGNGFQVGTLDLGISNRGNVDDELRQQGSSSHISGGGSNQYSQSGSYSSQSGGYREGQQSGYASGDRSHSSSSTYGANVNHGRAGVVTTNVHFEDGGGEGAVSYGHSDTIHGDPKLKLYPRLKRAVDDDPDRELDKALHCDIVKCAALRCVAGPLADEEGAWIAIRTRLVAETMHKLAASVPLNISTRAVARVIKVPYIGTPKDMPIKSHEVLFTATPEPVVKPDVVPLWVVILSACAGTIILLLLVFLLYKCGFFKRNRPSDSQERQPLNRNGNYHGDEHL